MFILCGRIKLVEKDVYYSTMYNVQGTMYKNVMYIMQSTFTFMHMSDWVPCDKSECVHSESEKSVSSESAVKRNKWLTKAIFSPILWSSDKPSTLWINTSNLMFGLTWNLKRGYTCKFILLL